MENPLALLSDVPTVPRLLLYAAAAVLAHRLVRSVQRLVHGLLAPPGPEGRSATERFARRYPTGATVSSLAVSALTFAIYFGAVGLILRDLGVDLGTYLVSASVIGLAIGFGSQGLVQDIVIGLTLVFSDAVDVGDIVELSGQIGRVERIGLRFTTLVNLHGQRVYVPNRVITTVGRFRGGTIRAYVDVQVPADTDPEAVRERVRRIAAAFREQHRAIVLDEPEVFGVFEATPEGWRYVRLKLRLWPGQGGLAEGPLRQRLLADLRSIDPQYADWMVSVSYRVA